jgi:putative effector of murein hydrolase
VGTPVASEASEEEGCVPQLVVAVVLLAAVAVIVGGSTCTGWRWCGWT